LSRSENRSAITVAVVTALVTSVFITPISSALSKAAETFIEQLLEDEKAKQQDDLKKQLEIDNLKLEIELKKKQLHSNTTITKRKSNFYETLEKYPKVINVSLVIEDHAKRPLMKEYTVERGNFKEFILVSDKLEPTLIEDAVIEIISPVLKKGDYKWRGIYEGDTVSFNMKSNEFKTLVQTGKIEFKNGSSIRCHLEIEKKVDNEGHEQVTSYNIVRVNEYFENDKPVETPEGRLHRHRRSAGESQISLWDNFDLDH